MSKLKQEFLEWLGHRADGLDSGRVSGDELVPRLAQANLTGIGVSAEWLGQGGKLEDAILAISEVAQISLTAAFTLWGQRTFIEYLLHSPNATLRERFLPDLVTGQLAGATGLSNAMKYLHGIEPLQVTAVNHDGMWEVGGFLPWVTNLRSNNFVAAVAVDDQTTKTPRIFAISHHRTGVERSDDLALMAMQASNTASLTFLAVPLSQECLIHPDARQFLPAVRPAFLGLQCGLSIGLAQSSLDEAEHTMRESGHILRDFLTDRRKQLGQLIDWLFTGLQTQQFLTKPQELFNIRIKLAELVQDAVQLELQALGGKAYVYPQRGFARRWREAAFIPVITPSVVQLRSVLKLQSTLVQAA